MEAPRDWHPVLLSHMRNKEKKERMQGGRKREDDVRGFSLSVGWLVCLFYRVIFFFFLLLFPQSDPQQH